MHIPHSYSHGHVHVRQGMHLLDDGKVLLLLLSGCSVTDGALVWLIKGRNRGKVVSVVIGMVVNEVAGDTVVVDDGR